MAKLFFMKFYPDAYLADTTHLTIAEDGAYLRLLIALWKAGGALPLDHGMLARLCKSSGRNWRRIWASIEPLFERISDPETGAEMITQKRLRAELSHAEKRSQKASESAAARWGQNGPYPQSPRQTHMRQTQKSILRQTQNEVTALNSNGGDDANACETHMRNACERNASLESRISASALSARAGARVRTRERTPAPAHAHARSSDPQADLAASIQPENSSAETDRLHAAREAIRAACGPGVQDAVRFAAIPDEELSALCQRYSLEAVILPVIRKRSAEPRDNPLRTIYPLAAEFAVQAAAPTKIELPQPTPAPVDEPQHPQAQAAFRAICAKHGRQWANNWLRGAIWMPDAQALVLPGSANAERVERLAGWLLAEFGFSEVVDQAEWAARQAKKPVATATASPEKAPPRAETPPAVDDEFGADWFA